MKRITRRDFMKGAAAGALGLAATGMLGCADATTSTEAGTTAVPETTKAPEQVPVIEEKWDYVAELAVVGSGCSLFGVVEALRQGHSVVVVEKSWT